MPLFLTGVYWYAIVVSMLSLTGHYADDDPSCFPPSTRSISTTKFVQNFYEIISDGHV